MRHTSSMAQEALLAYVAGANIKRGIFLIDYWFRTHGIRQTLQDLICPAVTKFSRFDVGPETANLTRCYILNTIIEHSFLPFAELVKEETALIHDKGPIVLGNVENDFHAVGRSMVATLARLERWKVVDLGADVLAEELIEAAVEHRATIIGVSAMTMTGAKKVLPLRQALTRHGLGNRIRLAAGGAIFALEPDLAKKMGADGTASDALEAVKLFERLDRSNRTNKSVLTTPAIPKIHHIPGKTTESTTFS